ncbi:MAG: hypothetical protein RLZZ299_2178 [Pseudomonadota bacterium]|jgi:hypothetical protein
MSILHTLALLTACSPMDAQVEGRYVAYLADGSSENLTRLERNGKTVSEQARDLGLVPVDCRELADLTAEELAAERLTSSQAYVAHCLDSAGAPLPLTYFPWLREFGYWKSEGEFAPDAALSAWRTEALLTSEGDLQLTAHIELPGLGDFRFGWAIDPDFQPTFCDDDPEAGAVERVVDGDWLAHWADSAEAVGKGGGLWPLNAGAYQVNPSNQGQSWYFPPEWMAGTAFSRLEDEQFFSHPTDYADPAGVPLYAPMYRGDERLYPEATGSLESWIGTMRTHLGSDGAGAPAITDLSGIGLSTFEPFFFVEDNTWRPTDPEGSEGATGLDGWLGVMPGWVRIDNPESIEVGNDEPVTGEFQVYLEGVAAASKVLVRATFSIDEVREDRWGYNPTMEERKRAENRTPVCGSTDPVEP